MKYYFKLLLFIVFIGIVVTSCKEKRFVPQQKVEEYVDPRMDGTMQRTAQDTAFVLRKVMDYLTKLKNDSIEEALDMLYEADGDTVIELTPKRRAEIKKTITTFPVLDYKIDQLLMYSETDTEVRYTIQFFEKEEGNPMQNTIQCVINPRRVGYYWYLTVSDRSVESNYREESTSEEEIAEEAEGNATEEEDAIE